LPNFFLEFGPFGGAPGAAPGDRHDLEVGTLEEAKIQAAMLYAGASFRLSPPTSYRIVGPGGSEVYRFPEAG
jgi:hypothetical protein